VHRCLRHDIHVRFAFWIKKLTSKLHNHQTTQQCRSEEHQEVAEQAQTLEEEEAVEEVALEVAEVSKTESAVYNANAN
jgi:glucan phosphoethanolaminetransferase (alkaline phosphatase superfamily)